MDIRIEKTRNSIINAFLELRSKKAIEKITIKELCEKAMINKSTFYAHFPDIYALSEYLEAQVTNDILKEIEHPEYLLSKPEEFHRQLIYAYLSHERLAQTLFSGSRAPSFLVCLENGLKEILFAQRPDLKDDVTVNVVLTYGVYGGFHAIQMRRSFGDDAVMDAVVSLNKKIAELLEQRQDCIRKSRAAAVVKVAGNCYNNSKKKPEIIGKSPAKGWEDNR